MRINPGNHTTNNRRSKINILLRSRLTPTVHYLAAAHTRVNLGVLEQLHSGGYTRYLNLEHYYHGDGGDNAYSTPFVGRLLGPTHLTRFQPKRLLLRKGPQHTLQRSYHAPSPKTTIQAARARIPLISSNLAVWIISLLSGLPRRTIRGGGTSHAVFPVYGGVSQPVTAAATARARRIRRLAVRL